MDGLYISNLTLDTYVRWTDLLIEAHVHGECGKT